jgi:glycosyltransferase involved in cell wall biosynthesis
MTAENLILITEAFPYGTGENFLEAELKTLSTYFTEIRIIPVNQAGDIPRNLPSNCRVEKPVLSKQGLIHHIWNLACHPGIVLRFLIDFILQYRVSRGRFSKCPGNLLLVLSFLHHPAVRGLRKNSRSLFYFYWGKGAALSSPFIGNGKKPVVRYHGSELYGLNQDRYFPLRKLLLKNSVSVFISDHGRKFMESSYPQISLNGQTFRLGIEDHGVSRPGDGKILNLVSCSSLTPLKRIGRIIDALNLTGFPVNWIHFGDGPLRPELEAMCRSLPDHIRVIFTGQKDNDEIRQFYTENPADLFINVSESEGVPVSMMEAISAEIPVIATAVGGVPEIVRPEHGILLPADPDPELIASELGRFYNLPENVRGQMRKNARQYWMDHYNGPVNYRKFAEFLVKL